MNPVFTSNITDKYGDVWRSAVTRVSDFEVFSAIGTKYKALENDTYEKVNSESSKDGEMPHSATYSIEFWSAMDKKSQRLPSRQFSKNGDMVFEVDFKEPEVQRVWENAPENYDQSLQAVMQWHFRTKVLGA